MAGIIVLNATINFVFVLISVIEVIIEIASMACRKNSQQEDRSSSRQIQTIERTAPIIGDLQPENKTIKHHSSGEVHISSHQLQPRNKYGLRLGGGQVRNRNQTIQINSTEQQLKSESCNSDRIESITPPQSSDQKQKPAQTLEGGKSRELIAMKSQKKYRKSVRQNQAGDTPGLLQFPPEAGQQ